MTSSHWSRFVGNFPSQLTQNMLSLHCVNKRSLVAILHLKHATEHFCIQPYCRTCRHFAILLSICQQCFGSLKMATSPRLLASHWRARVWRHAVSHRLRIRILWVLKFFNTHEFYWILKMTTEFYFQILQFNLD